MVVALLIAVHLATAFSAANLVDGLVFDRGAALRIAVGGQQRGLVASGQWWRLCTSVLLHADALHLGLNAVAIGVLGRLLEPLVGSWRWTGLFVFGGVVGSIGSQIAWVRASDGASGAAFALLGAALVVGRRLRSELDEEEQRIFGPVLGAFLALNVILSLAVPFVDAVGHFAGLGAGLVAASVMPLGETTTAEKALWALVIGAFAAVCVWGWTLPWTTA